MLEGNSGSFTPLTYLNLQALLNRNAKVYMASRSKAKAEEAISELREATGKEAIFLELDLANLASIKTAAQAFHWYTVSDAFNSELNIHP